MVDTSRSASDLLTNLFQDGQADGSITPQDIRDLIASVLPPYGGLYFSTPAPTTISVQGTYYKVAGNTTVTNKSDDVSLPTDNRLQFNGAAPRHAHIVGQASVSMVSGNNQDIGIQIYHWDDSAGSGSYLPESEARTTISGTDVEQITTHGDVMLENGDYLELHVANHSGTPNAQVDFGYLFFVGMLM